MAYVSITVLRNFAIFTGFLEFAYDKRLQQCQTTSRGKIHEKKDFGTRFNPKVQKSGPKPGSLEFSQVGFISFPLNSTGLNIV